MSKPPIDMSQFEVPDDDPSQQEVDSEFIQQGRRALASRAAAAGMTPMEYIASGQATLNTPTNAQREAPALPFAPITPLLDSYQSRAGEVGEREIAEVASSAPLNSVQDSPPTPAITKKSRIQEYIDSGKASQGFMEGFYSYFDPIETSDDDEVEVLVKSVDKPVETVDDGIIDAEIVEDE